MRSFSLGDYLRAEVRYKMQWWSVFCLCSARCLILTKQQSAAYVYIRKI